MKKSASNFLCMFFAGLLLGTGSALGQTVMPASVVSGEPEGTIKLNFSNNVLDIVLAQYAEITGKTLIKAPNVANVNITLKSHTALTETDALIAIETALALNNISFVPQGDNFIKVVQSASARQEGMPVGRGGEQPLAESDNLITEIVELKHLDIIEAQSTLLPILQQFMHSYGKIQPLQRANAFMLTDTAANIKRARELVDYIDRPIPVREELKIYEIRHAVASEIAAKLEEMIASAQSQQGQNPGTPTRPTISTLRSRTTVTSRTRTSPTPDAPSVNLQPLETGLVRGVVSIVPDDRTNILIITSLPENYAFFDQIIEVLDSQTEPELATKIFTLEFANAEETAGILNEMIGAVTSEAATGSRPGGPTSSATPTRSQRVQDLIRARAAERTNTSGAGSARNESLNQLSENTSILADVRTNSLLIMGRPGDIELIEDVIRQLDRMLAQVLIEAVILEVNLSDSISYGLDWLQRSMTVQNESRVGPRGGLTVAEPVAAFGGGQNLVNGNFIDGANVTRDTALSSGALSYFATFYDLNLDAILTLAAGNSDVRVLSTPVIMTTDNTEAQITVAEQRPIPTTSSTTLGGSIRSTFDYRDIGIVLTVTPRINPDKVVTMDISQSSDSVGDNVIIDGNEVPVILRREVQASISVSNRTTVVLGGLVNDEDRESVSKVPILGDIPLLGNLFRSTRTSNSRRELLILITPYVLLSSEDAIATTRRISESTEAVNGTWYRGWKKAPLADPLSEHPWKPTEEKEKEYLVPAVTPQAPSSRLEPEPDTAVPARETVQVKEQAAPGGEIMQATPAGAATVPVVLLAESATPVAHDPAPVAVKKKVDRKPSSPPPSESFQARPPARPELAPRAATKSDALTVEGEVQDVLEKIQALKEGEELTVIENAPVPPAPPAAPDPAGERGRFDFKSPEIKNKSEERSSTFEQPVRWHPEGARATAAVEEEKSSPGFLARMFTRKKESLAPSPAGKEEEPDSPEPPAQPSQNVLGQVLIPATPLP